MNPIQFLEMRLAALDCLGGGDGVDTEVRTGKGREGREADGGGVIGGRHVRRDRREACARG